jgi:hypothetical protein
MERIHAKNGKKTWNKIGFTLFVIEDRTVEEEDNKMELQLEDDFAYDQEEDVIAGEEAAATDDA